MNNFEAIKFEFSYTPFGVKIHKGNKQDWKEFLVTELIEEEEIYFGRYSLVVKNAHWDNGQMADFGRYEIDPYWEILNFKLTRISDYNKKYKKEFGCDVTNLFFDEYRATKIKKIQQKLKGSGYGIFRAWDTSPVAIHKLLKVGTREIFSFGSDPKIDDVDKWVDKWLLVGMEEFPEFNKNKWRIK